MSLTRIALSKLVQLLAIAYRFVDKSVILNLVSFYYGKGHVMTIMMIIQGVKKTDYTNYLSTFNLVGLDSKRFVNLILIFH